MQIPVLPLPRQFREWTHGLYCDEFAEFQSKDIPVRQRLGGFLPGNGVGTESPRRARAADRAPRPDLRAGVPHEDYEIGFRLAALGCRQLFVPVFLPVAEAVATREYFPRNFRAAVRQRGRWVTGISLQGWERHGWRGHVYWFWRDRKGLVGNLLSPATNLLFLYATTIPGTRWLCWVNLGFFAVQTALRTFCCARLYGSHFAVGVLPRMVWGNLINCCATLSALRQFATARIRSGVVEWNKTDHAYPRQRLGEVLVRLQCVSKDDLQDALTDCPDGVRIGEYLIRINRKLTNKISTMP